MISPILQTRRLRSREVRPFPGRACRWPVTVGEAEPVSHLPTRLPRTLLMAAYAKGWVLGDGATACCSACLPGGHPHFPGCPAAWPYPGRCPAQLKVLWGPGWQKSSSEARGSHGLPGQTYSRLASKNKDFSVDSAPQAHSPAGAALTCCPQ